MYISIDLGGTNTRVSSSKDLKTIYKQEKFKTNHNLDEQRKLVSEAIGGLIDGEEVKYICIGVPGFVDRYARKFGNIVNYPSLSGLAYEDFFQIDSDEANVIVENDAALAGLAEARRGHGEDSRVVGYLTLSTGVGGIRIQDKRISRVQGHSEPGHMIIVEDGRDDSVCGQKGCLHAYVAGVSFEEIYGMRSSECTDQKIWDEYGKHLSTGIINVISMWDPEIIVLGGGVSTHFDKFSPNMFKILEEQKLFKIPPIKQSDLGDDNGILGGFDLIDQVLTEE